ncbi:hypothetical protein CA51_02980 [Rosistilla oblonga]|nr:hypothetical protein CA51_02980 [Rosistilla oblonga]
MPRRLPLVEHRCKETLQGRRVLRIATGLAETDDARMLRLLKIRQFEGTSLCDAV